MTPSQRQSHAQHPPSNRKRQSDVFVALGGVLVGIVFALAVALLLSQGERTYMSSWYVHVRINTLGRVSVHSPLDVCWYASILGNH